MLPQSTAAPASTSALVHFGRPCDVTVGKRVNPMVRQLGRFYLFYMFIYIYIHCLILFDKQCVHMCTRYSTLKGSYCECKGRCLIRMLQLACGILPVDSRIKIIKCLTCEMSKCISTAQARTKVWSPVWSPILVCGTAQACTKCGSRSWSPAFFLSILAQSDSCEMS